MVNKLSQDEVKSKELEMLIWIRDFCKLHDLKYFLHGGTLIGAIRHQGFIPWDDDVDIAMPRADYNSFLSAFHENKKYKILSPGQENYYYAFSKFVYRGTSIQNFSEKSNYGLFIDIFPIDNVPANSLRRKIFFAKCSIFKKILAHLNDKYPDSNYDWLKVCYWKIIQVFNYKEIIRRFNRTILSVPKTGELCSTITTGTQWSIIYEKKWFASSISVKFENENFAAPVGYDALLRYIFGDYMLLPPKEKQVSHGFTYLMNS
ncbi:LicD family protein [Oenococcus sp.]|uniref:LicD family protein n=1 Tax=Oenococcus sp. TaxID=1979414 RepID=UPI0039E733F0